MSLFTRKIKNLIIFIFFFVAASSLLYTGCSVRERDNIFDPNNKLDSLDVQLILTSADSLISFRWSAPFNIEYSGFHIYRKVAGEKTFLSRAILPAAQFSFTDTAVSYDVLHSYYLTLIGLSNESPPSKMLHTIPGPGKIWLLDRWDEYFYRLSYDLRHKFLTHYAIWIPQELALNPKGHQVMITYPLFHYVELLDSESGALLADIENIRYPYACAYHQQQNAFWISDSTGFLYRFSADDLQEAQLIDDGLKKPETITIDASGNVYVLDLKLNQILVYNQAGSRINTITDFEQLIFLSRNLQGTYLYFVDKRTAITDVYKYSTLSQKAEKIYTGESVSIVRENPIDQTLWIAENMEEQARILQLSPSGVRLNTLSAFKNIEDMVINPYNGNIIVADSKLHQVVNLKPNGRVIGKISEAPYPYRIVIE